MARSRRLPKMESLYRDLAILQVAVPVDTAPEVFWRTSEGGTMHVRFAAVTQGRPWSADLYFGHFYRAELPGFSDVCRSMESLVGTIRRHLNC